MYFTDGKRQAFEKLMISKPGFDHYDTGIDGEYPECKSCEFHRPHWDGRSCVYEQCPYLSGRTTKEVMPPEK